MEESKATKKRVASVRPSCLVLGLVALLAACGGPTVNVRLTEADDGRTITLREGERFTVTLPSNRSTGYRWVIADSTATVIIPTQAPSYFVPRGGGPGVGGSETFTFRASKKGEQSLTLEYRRPWERGVAALRRASYACLVR
jgi:inhibitor of cysteine peptidase